MSEAIARTDEGQNQVAQLLALAVEKGLGVEGLEKLVALQERVMARQAESAMAAAMAEFQRRCPSIKKTSTARVTTAGGGTYSYTYAELDEIAQTVNPLLADLGLSYTWDSEMTDTMHTCRCTLRHAAGHQVTSSFTCPIDTTAKMNGTQKAGAALTYARRQSLISVLGLTTTDPDTDGASGGESLGTLSESQVADLEALIQEVGANRARFLAWIKAADVSQIRVADHKRAVDALEKMRAKR